MRDDAVIEPDESFNLVLSEPEGLQLTASVIPLTILNDDTLLDDYGNRYGLSVEDRLGSADGDQDGLSMLAEYGFNLDPTQAELPPYQPRIAYTEENLPSGLPLLVEENGDCKYIFPRRTDAAPRIEYVAEISTDGKTFTPIAPTQTTPLTNNWEEVEVLLPTEGELTHPLALLRVRFINNEE